MQELIGVGIDLVDLEQFRCHYDTADPDLYARCFASSEVDDCGTGEDRIARLAGRFAAKEAAYKALGGAGNAPHTDFVVKLDDSGKPSLALTGAAQGRAQELGISALLLSITHSATAAAAVVIALSGGPK